MNSNLKVTCLILIRDYNLKHLNESVSNQAL